MTRALTGSGTRFSLASWTVLPGDQLLLCSDGLTDVVTDDEIVHLMALSSHVEDSAQQLIGQALNNGTHDNVTCIVARVVERSPEGGPVFVGAAMSGSRS